MTFGFPGSAFSVVVAAITTNKLLENCGQTNRNMMDNTHESGSERHIRTKHSQLCPHGASTRSFCLHRQTSLAARLVCFFCHKKCLDSAGVRREFSKWSHNRRFVCMSILSCSLTQLHCHQAREAILCRDHFAKQNGVNITW